MVTNPTTKPDSSVEVPAQGKEIIQVKKLNESFWLILASAGIRFELSDYFKFQVPDYRFNPLFKMGVWDGYHRLYNLKTSQLPLGLFQKLETFCRERGYALEWSEVQSPQIIPSADCPLPTEFFKATFPKEFEERGYQLEALAYGFVNKRAVLVSPTASGKSAIVYGLIRHHNQKTLIIVPTTNLVVQLLNDFKNYSAEDPDFNAEERCHGIYSGQDKAVGKYQIVISTWQSLQNIKLKEWFSPFKCVLVDECHLATAKVLSGIVEKCYNASIRYGVSGTLDGKKISRYTLEGLFGPVHQVATARRLMDEKHIAELKIRCVVLNYPEIVAKQLRKQKLPYDVELKAAVGYKRRTKTIAKLVQSLEARNVLVMFHFKTHGLELKEAIEERLKDSGRKVFFVTGDTPPEEREAIRQEMITSKNAVLIASLKVFYLGINIPSIDAVINCHPMKAKVTLLQMIGRALRLNARKTSATFYDIADNIYREKSAKNPKSYMIKHFLERESIYRSEKFSYSVHWLDLEEKKT